MTQPRVLCLPHGSEGVQLYRFGRAAKLLDNPNLRVYNSHLGKGGTPAEKLCMWLEKYGLDWDIVWTGNYTEEGQAFIDMLEARGAKTVVDVDDWFMDIPATNFARQHFRTTKKRLLNYLLKNCERVVCSTPVLAEKHGGIVAPNFVLPEEWDWPERKSKRKDECIICCPSGLGRAGDYEIAKDGLQRALRIPGVKVVFVGWFPEWALNYPPGKVIWSRWFPIDMYQRGLKWIAPDIIFSPMQHNIFNEAKSNLKYLESGAVGACFVGERWGEYERTVPEGCGVLASGLVEWGDVLCELALDPSKRRAIAQAGRADVLANWTWDAVGDQWKEAIYGHRDNRRDHCICERGTAASGDLRQSQEMCCKGAECRESA